MAARLERGLEPCSRLADRNIVRQHSSAPAHAKHQGDGVHQMSAQLYQSSKQIKKPGRRESETKWDGEGKQFIHFFNQKHSSL
jgi:hypothetical protein